ncbi:MAG: flagellin [Nitrospirae bacterium]|nr:flagellin [Nitrospirota bacterium]
MAIDTSFSTRAIEAYNMQLSKSLERLSTGRKINRASDNPAGLAIVEKLSAQLKGIEQAERNIRQGMGMLQVAEGGISTIGEALGRMRELAVQAASGEWTAEDRAVLNQEFQGLRTEIGRISETTEYNQQRLLEGSATTNIQAGPNALGISTADISTQEQAESALSSIDTAIERLSREQAKVGAAENRFSLAAESLSVAGENTASSISVMADTDYALEASAAIRNRILLQSSVSSLLKANTEKGRIINLMG